MRVIRNVAVHICTVFLYPLAGLFTINQIQQGGIFYVRIIVSSRDKEALR